MTDKNKQKQKQTKVKKQFKPMKRTKKWVTKTIENVGSSYQMTSLYKKPNPHVNHSEMLTDVSGTTGYTVTRYLINACNSTSFPWLSQIAGAFEFYDFVNLKFIYETTATTLTKGTVHMAFCADPTTTPPLDNTGMANYQGAVLGKVGEALVLNVKCDRKKRYTQAGDTITNGRDPSMVFQGQLWVATNGCPDTAQIGWLSVVYDVQLSSPITDDNEHAQKLEQVFNTSVHIADMFEKASTALLYDLVDWGLHILLDSLLESSEVSTSHQYATIHFAKPGTYNVQLYVEFDDDVPLDDGMEYLNWYPAIGGPAIIEPVSIGPWAGNQIGTIHPDLTRWASICTVHVPAKDVTIKLLARTDTVDWGVTRVRCFVHRKSFDWSFYNSHKSDVKLLPPTAYFPANHRSPPLKHKPKEKEKTKSEKK